MATEPRVIDIEPDTDIARLLRDVSEAPVILNVAGERFRLQREFIAREPLHLATPEEIRRPPTPEQAARSIAGINRAAGSWKGLVGRRGVEGIHP